MSELVGVVGVASRNSSSSGGDFTPLKKKSHHLISFAEGG